MELKEKLGGVALFSTRKHVDKRLILLLGLFGIAAIAVPCWLMISDWRDAGLVSETRAEAGQAMESLMPPVEALNRVMSDEHVQALAVRALENPGTLDDLASYVKGRISQVSSVSVFGSDISALRPVELGPNGYALYELVRNTLLTGKGVVQIHHILQPVMAFDAGAIVSGGETVGVMVLELDPQYFISSFNPKIASLGFIRLTQYNGRQPVNNLGEWGDAGLLGEVPDRLAVPGTFFRLEFPLYDHVELVRRSTALWIVLAGVLALGGSMVLYRSNSRWEEDEKLKKASGQDIAKTSTVEMESKPADATFEPARLPREPAPPPPRTVATEKKPQPASRGTTVSDPPRMHLQYDINERRKMKEAEHSPVELTPGIFRAYDIRGVIDKTLDSGIARSIGCAVGSAVLERKAGPVVVARDGRLSGPYLMEGMIEGILSTGCDVLDIGAVPTGVLYYAAHEMAAGSGVMITGSHNPPDYNGFKIMIGGDSLHGAAITGFYDRIRNDDLLEGKGSVTIRDVVPDYIKRIASDIKVERDLKVVIDCGNGIGGVCAADTLRAIGVEVLPLFDEVDGTFPNHHPDPSEPENLKDLIESVRLMDADLGLALDGDADRLGVVTLAGNIIYADRIMMLLALDVLDRNPGATILYDVKCTGHLPKVIKNAGGKPVMYKTGHSLMKAKMKELGAPFAGEMSGHFFFTERWYGVDDGIYAAARLLEILGSTEAPPEAILNALPSSFSTPELKVQMEEGQNHGYVEAFKASPVSRAPASVPLTGFGRILTTAGAW